MQETKQPEAVIPIHRPGLKEKTFFLVAGILLSIPFAFFFESTAASLLTPLMPTLDVRLLLVIAIAPFIEEFAKAYPLFYRHGETQRSIVTLGYLVGFGFGLTEFLEYVLIAGVPLVIRLPGLVFHASSTAVTAYGIAIRKPAALYMLAVALHLSNNFFALLDSLWFIGWMIINLVTILLAATLYRRTTERFIQEGY